MLMLVKIMPADENVDLDELTNKISRNLPNGIELRETRKEPLAFGAECLLVAFTMPDEEGYAYALEDYLKSFPEIQEFVTEFVTRV
ncbi:MAG: elongation factor 1-beta [Thaumarchaeota archaeon]|nr:elongation factor 1-beta [Candidatus Terraquivivens yellowstonensis]MCL7387328.1 elongation factor 1-beta [Candidatus Terraquivivens yellowstonensis]MCL7392451.1 elongation factor 1-beta [Candidatus Terraquivivens yellowstonensis]MCL7394696.1 elongation factor 1-beta [Candidatus Terraquivivens yellowstonensis]MCL7398538.1 elongation factor 1-beta [Candidatus Terraquivivens yellowstonensis]